MHTRLWCGVGLLAICFACARAPAPVRPTSRPLPGGPVGPRLGIVGEAYTTPLKGDFFTDARVLVSDAFLMESAFGKGGFTTSPVFVESPKAGPTAVVAGETAFKIKWHDSAIHCYFQADDHAQGRIFLALAAERVDTHAVVVNTATGGGCSIGSFIFLGNKQATPSWIPMTHEFGHRLGLLDEKGYFARDDPHAAVLKQPGYNCSTCEPSKTWWRDLVYSAALPGCRLYSQNTYRPSNECRMGHDPNHTFCAVCLRLLDRRFAQEADPLPACDGQPGPALTLDTSRLFDPRAQIRNGYVQMLMKITDDPPVRDMRVLAWTPTEARVEPRLAPGPQHLYAIRLKDATRWQFAEFFDNDLFTRRAFQPGGAHMSERAPSVNMLMRAPAPLADALTKKERFTVALYEVRDADAFYRANIAPRQLSDVSWAPYIEDLEKLGVIAHLWRRDDLQLPF